MTNCVITYLFGNNKEIIRRPQVIDEDTEYLCITDNKNLKVDVWKQIYEPMKEISSLRDKVALVKFNPFKYTTAKNILVMDGTLEIKKSLTPIFEDIENYDIGLKLHTYHFNLKEELPHWKKRNLSDMDITKFYVMAKIDNIDLSKVTEYEGCLILYKNNSFCKKFCDELLMYMNFLGNGKNMIITNQCPLSYLIYKNYRNNKIYKIDQFNYFNRYIHNSNKKWNK